MGEIDTAKEYHRKGKSAEENKQYDIASKYYFNAAKHYKLSDQKFMKSFCEANAWYLNSFQYEKTIEGFQNIAEDLEKSILINNFALQYVFVEDRLYNKTLGNIRFQEGLKYNALANMEIKKGMITNGLRKANHFRKAAGFKLCSARAKFELSHVTIEENRQESYNFDLAKYLHNKTFFYYYRAMGEKELGNLQDALYIYNEAYETVSLAINLFNKILKSKKIDSIANNQIAALEMQKKIINAIEELELLISKDMEIVKKAPNIRVIIRSTEGLAQNLFSPIFIYLKNKGKGFAENITIDLISYIEGETMVGLQRLSANSSHIHSMAIKPIDSGESLFKIIVTYHDYAHRKFEIKNEILLDITKANQKRAKGKIIFDIKQGG